MTTSSALLAAWQALEDEGERVPGVYERRLGSHSGWTLFAGLSRPSQLLRISITVSLRVSTEGLERATRGLKVTVQRSASEHNTRITVELGHGMFREVFKVVAADVVARISGAVDECAAVAALRERLNHWERFMLSSGPGGLSRERQIGLVGELLFLRTLLEAGMGPSAVSTWKGPRGDNQDFRAGRSAVEVKTTTGNAPTEVRVSNELQLDDSECAPLFLLHLWLRECEGSGWTLPQLVDEVTALLDGDALEECRDLLAEAGYHEVHRSLYEEMGYLERNRSYYVVEGPFPRIRRADLRPGVVKVQYCIDCAGFEQFRREEAVVIRSLADGRR